MTIFSCNGSSIDCSVHQSVSLFVTTSPIVIINNGKILVSQYRYSTINYVFKSLLSVVDEKYTIFAEAVTLNKRKEMNLI